ncbi:MAG: aspartate dehydrogenase [Thermoplasmatota archaeon]
MKIGIIGCGFIGTTIGAAMQQMDGIEEIPAIDTNYDSAVEMGSKLSKVRLYRSEDLEGFIGASDLVIEAASQEAVETIGPHVVENGKDLMILSVGALVDDGLWGRLREAAERTGSRIFIPSGAIAGIDGIFAGSMADIECITLTVTKPPKGLTLPPSMYDRSQELANIGEPITMFDGSAREAVRLFPKNVNVAATIALAGIGFDRTRVKIVADPRVSRNNHKVEVRGRFGEMQVIMFNLPSTTNPRTSYMAPLSAISMIRKIISGVYIGN